jgi:hypothetical protein
MERVCSGHIVNVLSVAPGRLAVEGFSVALARQMAPVGIKVSTFEGSANGQYPEESARVAEAIIAAIDADSGEVDVRG